MNPFTEIKVAIELKKVWEREQKLMRLKLTTSTLIQILAGGVQALNIISPVISPKGKIYVAAGVGVIQVLINTISHLSNPDGTDAKTAYIPKQN